MDKRTRSTSSMMREIFGEDLSVIMDCYDSIITNLSDTYPNFKETLNQCTGRTAFLLPHMCMEYGYYALKGSFMPNNLRQVALSFGLIGLVAAVDDDVMDEHYNQPLEMVKNISTSEILQNFAYLNLLNSDQKESTIVASEIQNYIKTVTYYQYFDMMNIINFPKQGFNKEKYIEATYKGGAYIGNGLRLGILLANGTAEQLKVAETIGRYMGIVLQLLDDVLDMKDDIKNYGGDVITYPMYLKVSKNSFQELFDEVEFSLQKSEEYAKCFLHKEKILILVNGFRRIKEKVIEISNSLIISC